MFDVTGVHGVLQSLDQVLQDFLRISQGFPRHVGEAPRKDILWRGVGCSD